MKKICLLLLCTCSLAYTQAQPFNLDERVVPVELVLAEYTKPGAAKPNGRISQQVFTQENDTAYYFVKGLSMYSPTYFSIKPTGADADLKINLCQENWHQPHESADVKGNQLWESKFKTEGDFGIMVIANHKPAQYSLLAWTGKEMNVEMPSVFKSADGVTGGGILEWMKSHLILLIVSIIALVIIGWLLVKLKKNKS